VLAVGTPRCGIGNLHQFQRTKRQRESIFGLLRHQFRAMIGGTAKHGLKNKPEH